MPTTDLTQTPTRPGQPISTGQAVLDVLAGQPAAQVAAAYSLTTDELADAVETFQQAGLAAVENQAQRRDWYQLHVEFPQWDRAEHTAITHIAPGLRQLRADQTITAWWFIRKAPCWRLRLKPDPHTPATELDTAVPILFDRLQVDGHISNWRRTLYEPETFAFGGQQGIQIAHDLFTADSDHILSYLTQPQPVIGRRELSVLLCTTLFRAAAQEWFECGDIWHHVTKMRPLSPNTSARQVRSLAQDIRKVLTVDTRPASTLFSDTGPISVFAPWVKLFDHAGQKLRDIAQQRVLEQGLRGALRYHVVFHWNRLGLDSSTQSILAQAAEMVIFDVSDKNFH